MPKTVHLAMSGCLTGALAVLAAMNLLDESRLSSSWAVLFYWALWMVVPVGLHWIHWRMRVRPLNRLGKTFVGLLVLMQVFLCFNYLHYVLNGDTANRNGAEALHLILVPILSAVAAGAFLAGFLVFVQETAKRPRA